MTQILVVMMTVLGIGGTFAAIFIGAHASHTREQAERFMREGKLTDLRILLLMRGRWLSKSQYRAAELLIAEEVVRNAR